MKVCDHSMYIYLDEIHEIAHLVFLLIWLKHV